MFRQIGLIAAGEVDFGVRSMPKGRAPKLGVQARRVIERDGPLESGPFVRKRDATVAIVTDWPEFPRDVGRRGRCEGDAREEGAEEKAGATHRHAAADVE
jgi:hypothetical protein